jgi:hypothetical protein
MNDDLFSSTENGIFHQPDGLIFSHVDVDKKPRQAGRPQKYFTKEERRAAHVVSQTKSRNRRKPLLRVCSQGARTDEWYTPAVYLDAVRAVLGGIDLDPASSLEAQQRVQAARYFTAVDNGLLQASSGRVFLNPPYSQPLIEHFAIRLVNEVQAGHVREAILLTLNNTETKWFDAAGSAATALCLPKGRIKFVDARGQLVAPPQGQVFLYFGGQVERFREVFRLFGIIR